MLASPSTPQRWSLFQCRWEMAEGALSGSRYCSRSFRYSGSCTRPAAPDVMFRKTRRARLRSGESAALLAVLDRRESRSRSRANASLRPSPPAPGRKTPSRSKTSTSMRISASSLSRSRANAFLISGCLLSVATRVDSADTSRNPVKSATIAVSWWMTSVGAADSTSLRRFSSSRSTNASSRSRRFDFIA